MKKDVVLKNESFQWVDIENPSESDLQEIARLYSLPNHAVKDCLQPDHLPKYESLEDMNFLILRLMDTRANDKSKTIQELTRKIAVFQNQSLLLTIHRSEMALWDSFKDHQRSRMPASADVVVTKILKFVFHSFETCLVDMEEKVSDISDKIFSQKRPTLSLEVVHRFIRRVSTLRRILRMQIDVIFSIDEMFSETKTLLQDAREEGERIYFFADEVYDTLNMSLHTYFSESSHRTNEIMRVLTLFSAFFMPLTFIVGVYGMNFDFMPELRHHWGYPIVLGMMGLVSLGVFLWARRNGWFEKR